MTRVAMILALTALAAGTAAAADTEAGGPAVAEIVIRNQGACPVDESFIRAHIGSREGQPFDRRLITRDVRVLLDTARFSSVSVDVEPVAEGVRLLYLVRRRLRLTEPVEIVGRKLRFRRGKIRDWLGLEVGDMLDEQVAGAAAARVEDEYRDARYPDARVAWEIAGVDPEAGRARLRVEIDPGRRSRVKRVAFSGNESVGARALKRAVGEPAWWNPLGWIKRRPYDPGAFETGRLLVREIYANEGFLDAVVSPPSVKREDGKATVRYSVEEGPRYKVGRIELRGVALFPQTELRRAMGLRSGDTASAAAIDAATQALRDYYGSRGYLDTEVAVAMMADPDRAEVDLRYDVAEGELVRVRNIRIRGNTRTKDKVIRREMEIRPGDIYDAVAVRRSEARARNLGYFSTVRVLPEATGVADERNLVVEVEEQHTGQFSMGAGFSSIDNVVGFIELAQRNFDLAGWPHFTGDGQKLKIRGQFGSSRRSYELSLTEPWFLDRRLSLGFDLYRTEREYDDYDLSRTGGAVTLARPLPGTGNRIAFQYRLERNQVTDVVDTNAYAYVDLLDPPFTSGAEEYFFSREEDTTASSLKVTLTHDTRDNPFFPRRGNLLSGFGSVGGGALGFDLSLVRVGGRSSHYVPLWFGHVLSLRTRYEVVHEYGDTDEVPISDRLFLGGGRTLRGFDYRDVGPKVAREISTGLGTFVDARHVGGKSLALASVEYTVPVVAKLRLAGFYDTGNVWREAFELDPGDLASSAGVGIRLDVPGFPIRVDRGWVIEKDHPLTEEDDWVVWIGYDF